jgi:hypothetical protein
VLWFRVHTTLNFDKIPWDVRRIVIARLSLSALVNLASTSTVYRDHCRQDQALWRYHYRCAFPQIYPNFPEDLKKRERGGHLYSRPTPSLMPRQPNPPPQPTFHASTKSASKPPPLSRANRGTPIHSNPIPPPEQPMTYPNQPPQPFRGGALIPSNPGPSGLQPCNPSPISLQPSNLSGPLQPLQPSKYAPKNVDMSLSPLFTYPPLERGAFVLMDEDDISEYAKGRDWYLFFVNACVLHRRNAKSRVHDHYGDFPLPELRSDGPLLPASLHVLSPPISSPSLHDTQPIYTPKPSFINRPSNSPSPDGPRFDQRYMMSKRGPPTCTSVTFDETIITALEVGEFYEVDGFEESVDFTKPENRISYATTSTIPTTKTTKKTTKK